MDDTERASTDEAEEAARKSAAAVEAYESGWYEVLKRRAAEPEEDGEAGEADGTEQDDEG
ncbi:MAG: hypothetical protein ACXWEJ_07415 [Actinomycetota bacterium]